MKKSFRIHWVLWLIQNLCMCSFLCSTTHLFIQFILNTFNQSSQLYSTDTKERRHYSVANGVYSLIRKTENRQIVTKGLFSKYIYIFDYIYWYVYIDICLYNMILYMYCASISRKLNVFQCNEPAFFLCVYGTNAFKKLAFLFGTCISPTVCLVCLLVCLHFLTSPFSSFSSALILFFISCVFPSLYPSTTHYCIPSFFSHAMSGWTCVRTSNHLTLCKVSPLVG